MNLLRNLLKNPYRFKYSDNFLSLYRYIVTIVNFFIRHTVPYFRFLLIPLLCWLAYERTDGFSPAIASKTSSTLSDDPPSSETLAALAQPYRYLSRGRQCFVFESADGQFVVKLFNSSYLTLSRNPEKRAQRRRFFKESYLLAWRELRKETGLLWVHQGKSENPLPQVAFTDRIGTPFVLDLTDTAFVLQKKGVSLAEALPAIFEREGQAGVQRVVDLWTSFVNLRISKKIADKDADTLWNCGLCNGEFLALDPGRLCFDPDLDPAREWEHASGSFLQWLRERY